MKLERRENKGEKIKETKGIIERKGKKGTHTVKWGKRKDFKKWKQKKEKEERKWKGDKRKGKTEETRKEAKERIW